MRILKLFFLTIFSSCCLLVSAGVYAKDVKVFFIGNSLTYVHDIPAALKRIAKDNGHSVITDSYTPGGYTFMQHDANTALPGILARQAWDYVVLQAQSQGPAFPDHQAEREVFTPARSLIKKVHAANKKSKIVFYQTFARRHGDPRNAHIVPEVATYEGMQKRINRSYQKMADEHNALMAPVGEVWRLVRMDHPDYQLYDDDVHQSELGAYVAACTLYATIFHEHCRGNARLFDRNRKKYGAIDEIVNVIVLP